MAEVGADSPEDNTHTGARLAHLLDHLELSQTELAEGCNVSRQYVNNIVRGRQRMSEEFAQDLYDTVPVNLNWLYVGSGPMLRDTGSANPGNWTEGTGEALREIARRIEHLRGVLAEGNSVPSED